jgi:arylsulfatase
MWIVLTLGGDAPGWSLFLWEGRARFHYNFFGIRRYDVTSPQPLSPGKHTIEVGFTPESPKPGSPADVTLFIDGKQVAHGRVDEQVPMRCGTETMDVGMDCVSPVCHDYEKKGLFPFTGTIESVTVAFGPHTAPTGMERLEMSTKMD